MIWQWPTSKIIRHAERIPPRQGTMGQTARPNSQPKFLSLPHYHSDWEWSQVLMLSESLSLGLQTLDHVVKSCPIDKTIVPCLGGILSACRIIFEVGHCHIIKVIDWLPPGHFGVYSSLFLRTVVRNLHIDSERSTNVAVSAWPGQQNLERFYCDFSNTQWSRSRWRGQAILSGKVVSLVRSRF